jgi:hypothetical protein
VTKDTVATIDLLCEFLSFLKTESSLGAAVVVIVVDMQYLLARARQGSSLEGKERLLDPSAYNEHVPLAAIEGLHCVRLREDEKWDSVWSRRRISVAEASVAA